MIEIHPSALSQPSSVVPPPPPRRLMLNYASPQIPVKLGLIPMMTGVSVAFCLLGVFGVLLLSCTLGGAVGLAVFWIFGDRRVDYLGEEILIGAMLLTGATCVTLCWMWIRTSAQRRRVCQR